MEAGQLPAFESESQYAVRVRPRQLAGEALGFVMAAWSEGERIEDSDLYESTNFGLKQALFVSLAQSLILWLRTVQGVGLNCPKFSIATH